MTHFNPFPSKTLKQLTVVDLIKLQDVPEGWHIEYKEKMPNAKAVAKSISAFANTYGGWLFIGIAEAKSGRNSAEEFPGIPRSDIDRHIGIIRQAVAGHLSPAPHFDVGVIWGEAGQDLGEDSAVICVEVPESSNTPHIHSSGSIYRRVGDGSEPRPETDRHLFDALIGRRKDAQAAIRAWVETNLHLEGGRNEVAYLRFLFDADWSNGKAAPEELNHTQVREMMEPNGENPIFLPVDAIYRTSEGWVCRQVQGLGHYSQFSTTWLLRGYKAEVWVPLNVLRDCDLIALESWLDGYHQSENLLAMFEKMGVREASVVDLNQVFSTAHAIASTYQQILRRLEVCGPVCVKLCLYNVSGLVPYLDSPTIMERYEKNGLPFSLYKSPQVPRASDKFFEMNFEASPEDDGAAEFNLPWLGPSLMLFQMICRGFGIDGLWTADPQDLETSRSLGGELSKAGQTFKAVHRRRVAAQYGTDFDESKR